MNTRLNGGLAAECDTNPGDSLICRIFPAPATRLEWSFDLPESLARWRFTPYGDPPPGMYLTWAGVRGLKPEEFRQAGFNGEYFDVGALGDELFLRSGFYETEGLPPAETRWTTGRFEVELPVWPGQNLREVVLFGLLPQAVADRRIGVEATAAATGHTLTAEGHFTRTDYGEYVLRLPDVLAPGVQRLRFTVATWSPQDQNPSGDPRRLGFFLNAIGLRAHTR